MFVIVFVCICLGFRVFVSASVCLCVSLCFCVFLCIRVVLCVCMCVCMCVCVCVWVYGCVCVTPNEILYSYRSFIVSTLTLFLSLIDTCEEIATT